MYRIECYCGTFKNRRDNNEDNFFADGYYLDVCHSDEEYFVRLKDDRNLKFGVFDGLGGESKGEIASYTAASALSESENMKDYYFKANELVCKLSESRKSKISGTTVAAIEISDGRFRCSNIGDSRAYIIREGNIKQLSTDHTSLQTLIDSGLITKSQAEKSKYKNVLSQCLGMKNDEIIISPYFGEECALEDKDIILLCSDGLTEGLSDKTIKNIVLDCGRKKAVNALIQGALKGGSADNITIVILYINKLRRNPAETVLSFLRR